MPAQPSEQDSQVWIGQYIGNYRLVRLLGEGSMGMVFEGVHEGVGGRAAIKILRPEVTNRGDIAARFFNEARAANASQHPGIVRVFDSGYTPEGVAFLCMEYLDGESLRARLNEIKKFPVREALRVGRQIASALQAAHRKNIIHRDLKPDNIMLVRDPDLPGGERVKILDFGIAKIAESLGATPLNTHTNMVLGTPVYMAPEQCRGAKGVTDRSDVYALGVVLYRMLAGRPPFIGHSTGELMAMHLMDAAPPLREHAPTVGEPVAALIHAMLEKAPLQRPSMDSIAEQLQRLEKAPLAVATEPEPETLVDSTTTVINGAVPVPVPVPAPTVRAPVLMATPDAVTTRAQAIPRRRGLSTRMMVLGQTAYRRAHPRPWIVLLVLVIVLAVGVIVLLLQSAPQPESTGVEIRHSAATGTSGERQEPTMKKSLR